jgi:hypothetical protein
MLNHPVAADIIFFSPSTPPAVTSLGPNRLAPNGFLGAHMRVAADAQKAGWWGCEAQALAFIAEAKRLGLGTIFLATGSAEHRHRVHDAAGREGIRVVTKEGLLDGADAAELASLAWDQQAVVDSTWFYGFVRSSFSWSLALRRGLLPEAGRVAVTETDEYRDSLSALVGRYDQVNPEGLWP